VAAFTLDGSGRLADFSFRQVAALALAMKGLLGFQDVCLGGETVAGLALFHRLPLPPEVTALLVIVMTDFAGDPRLRVAQVAEPDRRFFVLGLLNPQPALIRRGVGAHRAPGPPAPEQY